MGATEPRVEPREAAPGRRDERPDQRGREAGSRRSGADRRSRARLVLGGAVALVVVAVLAVGAYAAARQVYFVGTDDAGLVTVYRGLPYDLPLGVELYSAQYRSGVPATSIPAARRARVLDHEWRSQSDADDLVRQLETGSLDPGRQTE